MVSIEKGPQERRCGTKGRNEAKSATQEENHNIIQDYAKVARPLNDLTKKDEPFVWKEAQQETFDKLKMLFTTAPVLAFPDNNCQFYLESNASEFATGAVLSILKEDK